MSTINGIRAGRMILDSPQSKSSQLRTCCPGRCNHWRMLVRPAPWFGIPNRCLMLGGAGPATLGTDTGTSILAVSLHSPDTA